MSPPVFLARGRPDPTHTAVVAAVLALTARQVARSGGDAARGGGERGPWRRAAWTAPPDARSWRARQAGLPTSGDTDGS